MMRLKQRLMPVVLAVAALAASRHTHAQVESPEVSRLFSHPAQPVVESVIRAQNGMPAPAGGFLPGGPPTGDYYDPTAVNAVPPQAGWQPWPGLSLFGERFRRLENVDGLWQYETRNDPRKFFAGIGPMFFRLRKPDRSLLGDDGAFLANRPIPLNRPHILLGTGQLDGNSSMAHAFKSEGLRFHWGFWDADQTGFELSAWWASDIRESYSQFSNFNPLAPPPVANTGPAIPTNNGGSGGLVFFDGRFRLDYSQTAANAQFVRMLQPLWQWNDAIAIHPTWGARYTFIHERMSVDGFDYVPPAVSQVNLNSAVTSHMAGPSIGLHYTVGGDLLKFIFNTNVIFYVNHQRERIEGFGFDDDLITSGVGPDFHDRQNQTHFSPAFEQTARAEIPIFRMIPYLNRIDFLRNGRLRGGVTYFGVEDVSRPNRIIDFRSAPLAPRLKDRRDKWSFIAYDATLIFEY